MINLVTGLPGSGKSLWTLKTVSDYVEKENNSLISQGKPPREVHYHGIPELTLAGWNLMDSPEDWIKLPPHSIIIIDECQSTFRPRAASVKPPPHIAEFETHRHKGLDFYLLTQHPMLVDGNIRRLAGKHYHVVRFYGFQKSTIHEFQSVRDNVDKNQKNSIETHFIFPKEVFKWYKSADAHTMKKRIPMRMIMVIVLPILAAIAAYFAYDAIVKIRTQPEQQIEKIKNGSSAPNPPTGNNSVHNIKESKHLSYVEARTPEPQQLPMSAPIYQDVVKPVTAPYPAACIYSNSKGCHCYTQQGTALEVSLNACMTIVKGGIFIDWKLETDNANNKTAENKTQTNNEPQQVYSKPSKLIDGNDYQPSPNGA